jgi:hypothetical protein
MVYNSFIKVNESVEMNIPVVVAEMAVSVLMMIVTSKLHYIATDSCVNIQIDIQQLKIVTSQQQQISR